jgi:AcrR family transcriptional regulator
MKLTQRTGKTPVDPRQRSAAPSDDAAAALLSAARQIFESDGLPALSVRRVAQAAGCTTMQVYSRYGGKDGLLQALFDEGFEALATAQLAVPASLPPAERVRRLCREYLRVAAEHPHHYALMLGSHSGEFQPPVESRERALATLTNLVEAVGNALPQTNDQGQRAREVAHQILAFCHGWATLSATQLLDGMRAVVVDEAISALLGSSPA